MYLPTLFPFQEQVENSLLILYFLAVTNQSKSLPVEDRNVGRGGAVSVCL